MNLARVIAVAAALALAAPAFAQDFTAWEGKNAVQEGDGGTKKTVNGIDFWADGSPPRKFKLIGYIHDRRHKSGLVGMVRMSGLESDIAKVAKANGGDAVILVASGAETVGRVATGFANTHSTTNASANVYGNSAYGHANTNSNTFGTAVATDVQKQESKYAVIQYL
ncbi:MAG: hypothetical protein WCH32_15455, partial [Pseudomonadota bacterium]